MIKTEIESRQQVQNGRYEGHYTKMPKDETSENPIDQAQLSPEAYRTVASYTNMVRSQCNKNVAPELGKRFLAFWLAR